MGMDLTGAGGTERFSVTSWCKVLELAFEYGWRPAGTQAPTFQQADDGTAETAEDWSGTYLTNASATRTPRTSPRPSGGR